MNICTICGTYHKFSTACGGSPTFSAVGPIEQQDLSSINQPKINALRARIAELQADIERRDEVSLEIFAAASNVDVYGSLELCAAGCQWASAGTIVGTPNPQPGDAWIGTAGTAATPEPDAGWLVGLGLVLLGICKRIQMGFDINELHV